MNATADAGIAGMLKRAWASWNDFWFRPADPTTLGVMRVIAGVLTLYVLAAYTPDLQEFFGPRSWFDTRSTEEWRKETPVLTGPMDWGNLEPNLRLPDLPQQRIEVMAWLRELGGKEERDRKIAFLNDLHSYGKGVGLNDDVRLALQFVQALPPDGEDREKTLGLVVEAGKRATLAQEARQAFDEANRAGAPPALLAGRKDDLDRAEKSRDELRTELQRTTRIPPWVFTNLSAGEAARFRDTLNAFSASLPASPSGREYVLTYLQAFFPNNTPPDWRKRDLTPRTRFLNFLNSLPEDAADRKAVWDYVDKWNVDPSQTLDKGMYSWSWLYHVQNPVAMNILHVACMGVVLLFTLGLWTRVTSVLTWVLVLSYTQRAQQAYVFGMDTMMNILLVYLMIGPSGAALSLDRLFERFRLMRQALRAGRPADAVAAQGPAPMASANFAYRLFQIHFCFIYMASGLSKLKGNAWWDHTATWYTLVNPEFCPTNNSLWMWFMGALCVYRPIWHLAMSGGVAFTLILEISLPFLVWFKRFRPWMVAGGFMLHLGIGLIMGLSIFSLMMMTLLLSFIPPEAFRARFRFPGLPKLRLRAEGEAGERSASWLFAFDAWHQIESVERTTKGKPGLEVVSAGGTVLTGPSAVADAARTLRLLRPFSWFFATRQ